MIHKLKILPEYFKAVADGTKTFEIRYNDRNFRVGDILLLYEFNGEKCTGRMVSARISYILQDFMGLKDNYVAMSIELNYKDFEVKEWA